MTYLPSQEQVYVFCGVIIKDKKFLLLQRLEEEVPEAHLKWEIPGGKCEFGETPEEAVRRECLEEAGVDVTVNELLPYIQTSYWKYPDHTLQAICFIFLCEYKGERAQEKQDHHVNDKRWFTAAEVKNLATLPGMKEIIEVLEEKYPHLM